MVGPVTSRTVLWCARLVFVCASLAYHAGPASALNAAQRQALSEAVRAAEDGQWHWAGKRAADVGEPLAATYIEWLLLHSGQADLPFARYADFVAKYPDWPGMARLQRLAEEAITDPAPHAAILAFFRARTPETTKGWIRYGEALIEAGAQNEGEAALRRAWHGGTLSVSEEKKFLDRYGELFDSADHAKRLDHLLWQRRPLDAERMMYRVDRDTARLARARIYLQRDNGGVDAAINAVPARLAADPGMMFDRLMWRHRRGRGAGVIELLQSGAADPGRPKVWWRLRLRYARDLLEDGAPAAAYRLVNRHGQTEGIGLAEIEWFAGWLALRFLDDPNAALRHFSILYETVERPISLARGAYWAGRAAEALGDARLSGTWYGRAALHATTYYGQLAAEQIGGLRQRPGMVAVAATPARDVRDDPFAQIIAWLIEIDLESRIPPLVRHVAETAPSDYLPALSALIATSGRYDQVVRLGKRASYRGIVYDAALYPFPDVGRLLDPGPNGTEAALSLAIARQETEFNGRLTSSAGAQGIMQLMPATAKAVAGNLRLRYDPRRVLRDDDYNATLGGAYIARLLQRYDGDLFLAAAAYNAGPGRITRWIEEFGDPRGMSLEQRLDWVERIPFSETRNYVQRVVEGTNAYRQRLAQRAAGQPSQVLLTSPELIEMPGLVLDTPVPLALAEGPIAVEDAVAIPRRRPGGDNGLIAVAEETTTPPFYPRRKPRSDT